MPRQHGRGKARELRQLAPRGRSADAGRRRNARLGFVAPLRTSSGRKRHTSAVNASVNPVRISGMKHTAAYHPTYYETTCSQKPFRRVGSRKREKVASTSRQQMGRSAPQRRKRHAGSRHSLSREAAPFDDHRLRRAGHRDTGTARRPAADPEHDQLGDAGRRLPTRLSTAPIIYPALAQNARAWQRRRSRRARRPTSCAMPMPTRETWLIDAVIIIVIFAVMRAHLLVRAGVHG